MGIRDIGFPLGIVGNHLASAAGGFEPQRNYNWVITIAGIGQGGFSSLGSAIGGAIGGAIGSAIGGAVGRDIGSALGGAGAGGGGAIELALDASSLPTHMVEQIELNYLNETRWVAGRANYEQIPLVLKDMVDVGVASACKEWFNQVHNPATHKVGLARDYKKIADITLIAPDGTYERTWRLHGCWPTSISYGQLDMNGNDIVKLEMNLRFDRIEALDF